MSDLNKDISFSINSHDRDGDVFEGGIYLHFGETRIRVADSLNDLYNFIERIKLLRAEIRENY